MSIFLKAIIVGEATAKLAIVVKTVIIEDGMSHPIVQSTYSSFAVQAFVLAKDISICATYSNLAQTNKLTLIDW